MDGRRDIPYTGGLVAVIAPTDSERECGMVGMIFDERGTLIVDCLHDEDEIGAFRISCRENSITNVVELATRIARPCPPPANQAAVPGWAANLFRSYRPR